MTMSIETVTRGIADIVTGVRTEDGAGVHLRRVFGNREVPRFDPYLMLDFFDSENPHDYTAGFPWHPHRGIETVTFLFNGLIEHRDSLGNAGEIGDGDCQWMTAGSGIIHQEMPKASPLMLGIQLWANLPAKDKMKTPHYQEIKVASVPQVKVPGVTVRVIAGDHLGQSAPFHRTDIDARFLDVSLEPGMTWTVPAAAGQTAFAVHVRGSAVYAPGEKPISQPGCVVLFGDGDTICIETGSDKTRFLLVSGIPIGEPVAWGGPIVMNTQAELSLAFEEYRKGTFIKQQPDGGPAR